MATAETIGHRILHLFVSFSINRHLSSLHNGHSAMIPPPLSFFSISFNKRLLETRRMRVDNRARTREDRQILPVLERILYNLRIEKRSKRGNIEC